MVPSASRTRNSSFCGPRRRECGYVLLTLLLVVSLMAITAAVAYPAISFEIRRDQEQEMIHRGVQYSRAIRGYFKKFGRYPTRLEDLENTQNLRFLRKRYKDPINGQDFRLLHYGEPGVTLAGGLAGGIGGSSIPGASAIGSPGGLNSAGGFSQPSAFGGNANSAFGGNSNGAFGGNSNGGFGAASNSGTGSNSSATNAANTDPSQSSSSSSQDSGSAKGSSSDSSDQSSSSQLVASGPIVGVASVSKKTTIREFNKKKKYNEWQFVYDPTSDHGGIITTPNQPNLQTFSIQGAQSLQPGQNGQTGTSTTSPFGSPSGFGNQSSGFGNQPSSFGSTPAQPPSNSPPQQQ
jgi:type II secretory pathway pseudopilin PulG